MESDIKINKKNELVKNKPTALSPNNTSLNWQVLLEPPPADPRAPDLPAIETRTLKVNSNCIFKDTPIIPINFSSFRENRKKAETPYNKWSSLAPCNMDSFIWCLFMNLVGTIPSADGKTVTSTS